MEPVSLEDDDHDSEAHSELGGVTVDSRTIDETEGSVAENARSTLSGVPSSYEMVGPAQSTVSSAPSSYEVVHLNGTRSTRRNAEDTESQMTEGSQATVVVPTPAPSVGQPEDCQRSIAATHSVWVRRIWDVRRSG